MKENKKIQILDTGLGSLQIASKKVVYKAGKSIGNKIAGAVTKSNGDKILKQELVKERIIQPENRENILNQLKQALL